MSEYIMERFHRNVSEAPNAPLFYDDTHPNGITFRQFDEMSARVYGWLKKQGIGREDFVLIHLPRGLTPFAVAAGVWKAGAAFVITEENNAPERTAFIREDCACRTEIRKEDIDEIMGTEPLEGWEKPDPHDAAFAVYTSGSTGKPKGVLHEYGNIDRCLASMELEGDPMLGSGIFRPYTSPLTFVAAVIGLTAMLAADHAQMYIVSYATAKNPDKLLELYETYHFNMAFLSPSYARVLGPKLLPYIKTLVVAAEPAGDLYFPGIRMLNFYGGSESYFLVATYQIERQHDAAPVGKPAFPLDIRLVGEDGEDVSEGESGELIYDNPYFRGYIHRPEENAAALRDGYFHSGDLARRDEDGNLIILGRLNDMIKINGNRVEPAEIEKTAKRVLGVDWAAAKAVTDKNGRIMVCVYYTADISFDAAEVRRQMMAYLPYYMIPSHFIRIDEVPLLSSGKLNRKALPAPDPEACRQAYRAPKNETERKLCTGFERALGIEGVGAGDDFYELGGDSLRAIVLTMESGLPGLDAEMIFRGRTPEKIAALYLAERREEAGQDPPEERNRQAMCRPHPLTTEQIWMLDVQLYTPKSTMYNLYCLLRAEGHIDAERLARAVGTVLRAHPAYLTTLRFCKDGTVVQQYTPEKFEEIHAEKISEKELNKLKDTLVQPFGIIGERLYRCQVFETEKNVYLFLDIHHIVSDGTSFRLLMSDIDNAYFGRKLQQDYYYLMLERREKERESTFYQESKKYFEEKYNGIPWACAPKMDHTVRENESDEFVTEIPLTSARIRAAEIERKVSRNELMITAATLAIAAYNRTGNVRISWIYNDRSNHSLLHTAGLLYRELPVAIRLQAYGGMEELFRDIRDQVRRGIEHSCYPYAEACFSGINSVNTCLLYQQNLYGEIRIGDTVMTPMDLRQNRAASQTILDIEIMDGPDGLRMLLDYASSLYDRSSMLRFRDTMVEILKRLMDEDPGEGERLLREIQSGADRELTGKGG